MFVPKTPRPLNNEQDIRHHPPRIHHAHSEEELHHPHHPHALPDGGNRGRSLPPRTARGRQGEHHRRHRPDWPLPRLSEIERTIPLRLSRPHDTGTPQRHVGHHSRTADFRRPHPQPQSGLAWLDQRNPAQPDGICREPAGGKGAARQVGGIQHSRT